MTITSLSKLVACIAEYNRCHICQTSRRVDGVVWCRTYDREISVRIPEAAVYQGQRCRL